MNKSFFGLLCAACCFIALGLAGCANGGYNGPVFNCYLTQDEPLLEKGPAQETPADATLPSGTRVRVVSGGGAYMLVETVSGKQGWVPASAVKMQEDSSPDSAPTGAFGSHSGW